MRSDLTAPPRPTLQSPSPVVVTLYPIATVGADLVRGTAAGGVDYSGFAADVTQSDSDLSIRFAYHGAEFTRPAPLQPVTITRGGVRLFTGLVDTISRERVSRDERSCTVAVRRRDGFPWWRELRRLSSSYSVGTDLGMMARDVASAAGLAPSEYALPDLGIALAHDTTQLADMSSWDMLELIAAPALREPYFDALGRLKFVSRDPRRAADLVLTNEQIVGLEWNAARPTINTFRVKYLDPALTRVQQRDQVLTTANLTCGVFQPSQSCDVWWSQDHTLRCENPRLVVKQSATSRVSLNPILLARGIGSEWFERASPYGGKMKTEVDGWILVALYTDIFLLSVAIASPDLMGFGSTAKTIAVQVALGNLINDVLSIGFGVYEFRGEPYDEVHAVNEVEAYDAAMPDWAEAFEETQNDLVPNESVAQAYAVNELVYRSKAAGGVTLTIADDPRIERGDLLALPDGRRFYTQSLSRKLARGAEATLALTGFLVP